MYVRDHIKYALKSVWLAEAEGAIWLATDNSLLKKKKAFLN